jgi:hypothetical protein
MASRRHYEACGVVRLRCWQIAGSSGNHVVVLIRLMLVVLIPADGFQSSG